MVEFATAVASQIGVVLYEGSLYILVGFLVAGILHEYLPTEAIARHLGGENIRSVVLAALFGAPIPLCSCGVLPAAAALRAKGASKSATLSFLISTPETGVDSIALTYGLLGPVMAVVRPIVAIATGVVAGVISMVSGAGSAGETDEVDSDVRCHAHADDASCRAPAELDRESTTRLRRIVNYGFVSLLDELAFWIVVGVSLTGLLAAALPDDFFATTLGVGSGVVPMLAMVVVGAPLYLCASASTPIAAALIAKGLSPGAALVFLLVGPATNAATMTVTARLLGARRLKIYLASIVIVSIGAGLLLDALGGEAVRTTALSNGVDADALWQQVLKATAAVLFVVLLAASMRRTGFAEGIGELKEQSTRLLRAVHEFEWRSLLRGPVLAGAAAITLIAAVPTVTLVVSPGQRGIVRLLGRVVEANLEPGLYLHLPPPLGEGLAVDVDLVRQIAIGFRGATAGRRSGITEQAYYLTADENIIDIRAVVHYRVSDPVRYALGTEAADDIVRSIARRELVDTVGRQPIDTLYTVDRRPTEQAVLEGLRHRGTELGVGCEIIDVRLLDVHAPADIHDAFRDVSSALEDRDRDIKVAGGYAAELRAEAEGQAAAALTRAHGDAFAQRVRARAAGAAFVDLAGVHRSRAAVTETRLYLETLERALVRPTKYIGGAGVDNSEIDLWIGTDGKTPPAILLPSADEPRRAARRQNDNDDAKEPMK